MADKDVTINVSGTTISASPESVRVKQNNEKVKWQCTSSENITGITVNFPGQPTWSVTLTQNGGTWRGQSKEFPDVGTFKYDIDVAFGSNVVNYDPEVVVDSGP